MLVKDNRVTVVSVRCMGAHLWFGGWGKGSGEAMCYSSVG